MAELVFFFFFKFTNRSFFFAFRASVTRDYFSPGSFVREALCIVLPTFFCPQRVRGRRRCTSCGTCKNSATSLPVWHRANFSLSRLLEANYKWEHSSRVSPGTQVSFPPIEQHAFWCFSFIFSVGRRLEVLLELLALLTFSRLPRWLVPDPIFFFRGDVDNVAKLCRRRFRPLHLTPPNTPSRISDSTCLHRGGKVHFSFPPFLEQHEDS